MSLTKYAVVVIDNVKFSLDKNSNGNITACPIILSLY